MNLLFARLEFEHFWSSHAARAAAAHICASARLLRRQHRALKVLLRLLLIDEVSADARHVELALS